MATTKENLEAAFAGESQAFQKYTNFADKAERDGFPNVARLFRTAAQAERIHAGGHFAALEGVGSTVENLEAAIGGETHEFTEMYPPMLEQAKADGHAATRMFAMAVKAEEVHAKLYTQALDTVRQGNDLAETEFFLCPVCGHIEFGNAPDNCPICGTPADNFTLV
jgi:rubrerythrin